MNYLFHISYIHAFTHVIKRDWVPLTCQTQCSEQELQKHPKQAEPLTWRDTISFRKFHFIPYLRHEFPQSLAQLIYWSLTFWQRRWAVNKNIKWHWDDESLRWTLNWGSYLYGQKEEASHESTQRVQRPWGRSMFQRQASWQEVSYRERPELRMQGRGLQALRVIVLPLGSIKRENY